MSASRIVALDTSALSVLVGVDSRRPERSVCAKHFFELAKSEKSQILLPAPVVFEVLNAEPDREARERAELALRNGFRVVPFDHQAAMVATELWLERFKAVKKDSGEVKRTIIADLMIVACAIARGAEVLYTYDSGLRLWSQGRSIQVAEFPRQVPNMFESGNA